MEPRREALKVGERIRRDAIGDWHRASLANRDLTLRILREDLVGQDHARLLFEEEIRRIARLDHPSLLRVLRVSRKPPRPWLLTLPITGGSLEEQVLSEGPLPAGEAVALVGALLDGFEYMAARKQVHAWPVPSRVVRIDESWRLTTFRDVRAWDELKSLKGKKHPAPAFAPPEAEREHPEPLAPLTHTPWALGALLRFSAGGGAPRQEDGSPAALPPGFPERLRPIVAALCALDPGARPQGERALRAALEGRVRTGGEPAPGVGKAPLRAPVPRRRRRGR